MKLPRTTPSWPRVACVTAAAMAACYPLGKVLALVWFHPLMSFAALLIVALATMQLHPRSRRVAGVPVEQDRVTVA